MVLSNPSLNSLLDSPRISTPLSCPRFVVVNLLLEILQSKFESVNELLAIQLSSETVMALRFCPGYGSLQLINPMISTFQEREPYIVEDVSNVWGNYVNPVFTIDSIPFSHESDEYFYQENGTYLSPYFPELSYFGPPANFPTEDEALGCYYCQDAPHAKRLRTMSEYLPSDVTMMVNYGDDPLGNQLLMPELSPVFPNPRPAAVTQTMQNLEAEAVLSPQSVAARQRRKKISEKTHELGRLIPGGTKINTAEMLAAAAKYVKFLQAQVRVLEFLNNSTPPQEEKEDLSTNLQFHHLLASLTMQEKLYEAEKCILPIKSVKSLERRMTND